MVNISVYFKKWRDYVSYKKYDRWCEIHNEELDEINYARENNMESFHWCWNCKYSDCDIHT